jgi:hypothetical protein
VAPPVVRLGQKTIISWTATDIASCTIAGNGGTQSITTLTGSIESGQIQGETTYTLNCPGVSKSATVKLIPAYKDQ